jgi:tight adherence protein B
MREALGVLVIALAVGVTVFLWRRLRVQRLSRERLEEPDRPAREALPETRKRPPPPRGRPYVRSHYVLPWVVGVFVGLVLYFLVGWPWIFAVTFGLIAALLGGQLETLRVGWVTVRIEQQLADALDLMVAGLQAGAGTMAALDNAVKESRPPLRPQLEEVLGRIRYGDDPQVVLRALEGRVPLEVFRLFVSALSVHWETGGSLGPTLATVGRVVRDRIEVNRRIRTLTTQGRISVIAVLFLTYFLALIMWRNDPERMRQFLSTTVGQVLMAAAMLLQAVGIVWTASLSRLKY